VTKPNPENCKNCSSKCAYDCAQLSYTIQHRTVLIISSLTSRQHHSPDVVYQRRGVEHQHHRLVNDSLFDWQPTHHSDHTSFINYIMGVTQCTVLVHLRQLRLSKFTWFSYWSLKSCLCELLQHLILPPGCSF